MRGQQAFQEKRIGDYMFRVRMLDPETSEDLFLDLLKHLGPSVAAFLSEVKDITRVQELLEQSIGSPAMLAMIREFVDRLDKPTYHRIVRELAQVSQVKVADKWPILSEVQSEIFRGRIVLRLKWLWFALGVQYGGFFDDLGGAKDLLVFARGAGGEAISRSTSPTGSHDAGASGDS